ncbi:MAG: hypothetical protein AAF628_18350 [Planctomycetota bacterium]
MTEHLDVALTRLLAGDLDAEATRQAQQHLRDCAVCQEQAEAFRQIDAVLGASASAPLPASAQWIVDAAGAQERVLVRRSRWLVGAFVIQFAAGITALVVFIRSDPLLAGLAGGVLIGDAPLLLVVAYLARRRSDELAAARADWQQLRRRWGDELEQRGRAARWCLASAATMFFAGAIFIAAELAGSHRSWQWPLGIANVVLSTWQAVVALRMRTRSRAELARLRSELGDEES